MNILALLDSVLFLLFSCLSLSFLIALVRLLLSFAASCTSAPRGLDAALGLGLLLVLGLTLPLVILLAQD
jgi:hypothetical protein